MRNGAFWAIPLADYDLVGDLPRKNIYYSSGRHAAFRNAKHSLKKGSRLRRLGFGHSLKMNSGQPVSLALISEREEIMKAKRSDQKGPVYVSRPEPGVAVVTIDHPERRNALNLDVKNRVADYVEDLGSDDTVRVIVVTGANGVFVAGTDIAEMAQMSPTDHSLLATDRVFTVLRKSIKIVIAAVEGYALGGGCELALACDMVVTGENAKFGQPEIRVGIMPGAGGTQRLVRTVGKYRAMKMILTGEHVSAQDAFTMGLLSEMVADGQALERAIDIGRSIMKMPPLAVRAIKEVVQLGQDVPLETALQLERKSFQLLFDTLDQKEGMLAFLEKRDPTYQGK